MIQTIIRPNSQQMARTRPLRKRPLGKRHLGRGHLAKRPLGKTHLRWNSSPRMATCPGQRRQSKRGKYH